MEFIGTIKSVEQWKQEAPPKKPDLQWKDRHSAKELARYIVEDNYNQIPIDIRQVIENAGIKDQTFLWKPEYTTDLPGQGEGRNHDLAVFSDSSFIGIEAKVNESYGNDKDIRSWLKNTKSDGSNKGTRLESLCQRITGSDNYEPYMDLRYQLFQALAGTMIEAKEKPYSVFLVLDFLFDQDKENDRNRMDFDRFCSALNIQNEEEKCRGNIVFWGKVPNAKTKAYVAKVIIKK